MADPPVGDGLTASERRLDEHLALLRNDPPRPGAALVRRVMRTAHWQRAVRGPLHAVTIVAGGVIDGLALLLGARRRRGPT